MQRQVLSTLGWTAEVPRLQLSDLTASEAVLLVRSVSGGRLGLLWEEQLAAMARDCPALLVAGAAAVDSGRLAPLGAGGAAALRDQVMLVFADEVGDLSGADGPRIRKVLRAVSALQPLRWGRPAFDEALEQLSGMAADDLEDAVVSAERRGLLLRHGSSYRVVPDLLGDALLAEGCRQVSGRDSTFFRRLVALEDDDVLAHVIDNTARLDWQSGDRSLSDAFWDELQRRVVDAPRARRTTLVEAAARAAGHRPDRALRLAELVLHLPTTDADATEVDAPCWSRPWSRLDAVRSATPLLREAAHQLDLVAPTADVLWALVDEEDREPHQFPGHPLRVLQEMAEFGLDKPLAYNEEFLEHVIRWSADPAKRHRGRATCLDLLRPLLDVDGNRATFDGGSIVMTRFAVPHRQVAGLRAKILSVALQQARSTDFRQAAAAARLIDASLVLRPAQAEKRSQAAVDEEGAWAEERVRTFSELLELARDPRLEPDVSAVLQRALLRHHRFGVRAERQAARAVLDALPRSAAHLLANEVQATWSDWLDEDGDWQRQQQRHEEALQRAVTESLSLWGPLGSVEALLRAVSRSRYVVEGAGGQVLPGTPWYVASVLAEQSREAGEALLRLAVDQVDAPEGLRDLAALVPPVVGALASTMGSELVPQLRAVASAPGSGGAALARSVARGLGGWRGRREDWLVGERELLADLLRHRDPWVVAEAVRTLHVINARGAGPVVPLLQHVDLVAAAEADRATWAGLSGARARGNGVLHEVLALVGRHGQVGWDAAAPVVPSIVAALQRLPSLDDYEVVDALADLSASRPHLVLDLLLARAERQVEEGMDRIDAFPVRWPSSLRFRSTPSFTQVLERILDWLAVDPRRRTLFSDELFAAVVGPFDADVLGVLSARLQRGLPGDVAVVASTVRGAPRDFLWHEVELVEVMLRAARHAGSDVEREVRSSLFACVTNKMKVGTAGQPFAEDIECRDEARAALARIGRHSPATSFYADLLDGAERAIQRELDEGRGARDGRRW
ncbi:hypothetical protein [Streptomyces sp. NP160]|uniref:hypothetical protein n=1 Tax=Streptomyces sp. NP160 TaxID=2586637 RepID=UPI00214CEB05|nr:hypothetical protein [Streptomyces sp. NP160]